MPSNVDSPVQTQVALPVPDAVSAGICARPVGRRRIFVQTDTGSVLGIELDRADNVQTVKKKMQTMLNVPTEQTALVFGDTVLKSDLSELRNDTPLLLTRGLQRSLSTPCLSPASDTQVQIDGGQPLEVVGGLRCCSTMKRIITEIVKAIECGVEPIPASGGLGGAYYFRNSRGESVAIVKPTDEEPFAPNNPKGFVGKMLGQPGLKRAVRVGETGVREVVAYLLDHDHFAKVPPTVLVKVSHHVFHVNSATPVHKGPGKPCSPVAKIASCQQFVHHDYDASDHGTSRFSVSAVHRIGILDIRIFNTDRHAGNILVRNVRALDRQGAWSRSSVHVNEALELIPIDHGLCLPEALEDPYFEWLHWPQASVPFSEEELDYISRLDGNKDVELLRVELPMLREACFRMLLLSTAFLKTAAAAGLCLAEIGEMMSRDGMEEASELELFCLQAKLRVEEELSAANSNDDDVFSELSFGEEEFSEQFEFEMDQDESEPSMALEKDLLSERNEHASLLSLMGSKDAGKAFVIQNPNKEISRNGLAVHTFSVSPPCVRYDEQEPQSQYIPTIMKANFERSNWPSPLLYHSASPKMPRGERIALKVLCESSALEEDDGRNSPPKLISTSRTNSLNKGCSVSRAFSLRSTSEMRSPKGLRARTIRDFTPLVEEVNENMFAEMDPVARMAFWKIDGVSPRAMSFKSVSFGNRKQRHPNYPEPRGFGMPGISASQTTGKANAIGNSSLSLGDMSEEEWSLFMDCFLELLQQGFATRCDQNVRQRLGISCQF